MSDGDSSEPQGSLSLSPSDGTTRELPPPVVPPQTSAPVNFGQVAQVNIQQIPPSAWEKLSADQIVALSQTIVAQIEKMDERRYQHAITQLSQSCQTRNRALLVGGAVAICGLVLAAYLTVHNGQIVGGIIATFLATIIAVTLGSQLD